MCWQFGAGFLYSQFPEMILRLLSLFLLLSISSQSVHNQKFSFHYQEKE